MNGSFNEQILVEKLAKLTNSQQMIETLSHWCIFNRNKAKQVVEIWQRQFHCAPRDQRVSYLYLANDILQNSRWKGVDFIDEFWKVLPGALNDVFNNGGEIGRTTVLRLINIWEERKVFGSQGQSLKDNFLRRNTDNRNRNRNEKGITHKLKHPVGKQLEKLISGYNLVDRLPFDEDTLFGKCQAAINLVEEVEKELRIELGNFNGSEAIGKLQLQHGVLRECIDQLKVVESSRETLITYLRKALYEQESKFEQVHQQLQASQSRYEQSVNLYKHLRIGPSSSDQRREKSSASFNGLPSLIHESFAGTGSQTSQGRYTQEEPTTNNNSPFTDGNQKTAPAAVAAQLAPSTSFGYMPGHVLSYLDSDGTYGLPIKEDHPPYVLPPQPHLRPLFTPFPYPDLMNQPPMLQLPYPVTYPSSGMVPPTPPPPPPSFLPPPPPPPFLPPPPPPPPFLPTPIPPPPAATSHFMQIAAGPTTGGPFGYGPAPFPNYTVLGMHPYPSATNPYHGFEAPEGGSSLGQPPY